MHKAFKLLLNGMMTHLLRTIVLLMVPAMLATAAAQPDEPDPVSMDRVVDLRVFLVRHAENRPGEDSGLSAVGYERATALANCLAHEGLLTIHATDTQRTRQTATAVAARLGLSTQIYDPDELQELAGQLREAEGPALVVGHSDTTPKLAEFLGGDPGPPIEEDEFDRLYEIFLTDGETRITSQAECKVGP